jgi:uncharacterized protein
MRNIYISLVLLLPNILLGQKTILWKVTHPNNTYTSYLLGTNHILNQSFVDSFPIISEKLKQCDLVITETEKNSERIKNYYNKRDSSFEIDKILNSDDIKLVNDILKYSSAKNIYKFTSGELFAKLSNYYEAYSLGLPADKIFIDAYVQLLAKENHKKQYFFESDILQLEMLKKASEPLDWNYFKTNITALLEKYRNPVTPSNSSYSNFVNLNISYSFSKSCPQGILLRDRNKDWVPKIKSFFNEQNCFLAVGLLHLDYDCGLIEQLKKQGFKVEPLQMK